MEFGSGFTTVPLTGKSRGPIPTKSVVSSVLLELNVRSSVVAVERTVELTDKLLPLA